PVGVSHNIARTAARLAHTVGSLSLPPPLPLPSFLPLPPFFSLLFSSLFPSLSFLLSLSYFLPLRSVILSERRKKDF
ncbi:hypothetical protein, partial [Escherichia coli]|uniref:hypothetical protein n=1 Tax=Escherichia coli TaxID=562 RepID=UPI00292E8130